MIDPVSAADGHTYERRVIQGGWSATRPARIRAQSSRQRTSSRITPCVG
jgi:hypothetical protein